MPNAKNIEKYKYKKGESGNLKGRPTKVFSDMAKAFKEEGYENVSASSVVEAFEMLLGLPESRLREIMNDPDQPVIFKITIKAMTGTKGFEVVSSMFDRAHGKPTQKQILAGDSTSPVTIVVNAVKPNADHKLNGKTG